MKFEFGDLYKFIVSLGVVLVSLAILAPWLFLKESFDLLSSEADIEALSDIAQSTIEKRQKIISFIIQYIPWFSALSLAIGVVLICVGLRRWYINQLHIDEQTILDVQIKKQLVRDATDDEIEESETLEYVAQKVAENSNAESYQINTFRNHYSQTESLVYTRMSRIYTDRYDVNRNQSVAGLQIDILVLGKRLLAKDYIVEVKYIRKGFNFGWLHQAFLKNIYTKSVYSQVTNKQPNTLLLIVIDSDAYDETKYTRLLQRLIDVQEGREGKDLVRIITEQKLANSESSELQKILGIYA